MQINIFSIKKNSLSHHLTLMKLGSGFVGYILLWNDKLNGKG